MKLARWMAPKFAGQDAMFNGKPGRFDYVIKTNQGFLVSEAIGFDHLLQFGLIQRWRLFQIARDAGLDDGAVHLRVQEERGGNHHQVELTGAFAQHLLVVVEEEDASLGEIQIRLFVGEAGKARGRRYRSDVLCFLPPAARWSGDGYLHTPQGQ